MDQESTTAPAPADGQEPEGAQGQEPAAESKGKTFDEAYVKQLRKENAAARSELNDVKSRLDELTNTNKSEFERMTERVSESEQRAGAAEARLIRYEVAAEQGLELSLINAIAGESREEIEANAQKIAQQLATTQPKPPSFDGGARTTPEQTVSPETAHNQLLMGLLKPQS